MDVLNSSYPAKSHVCVFITSYQQNMAKNMHDCTCRLYQSCSIYISDIKLSIKFNYAAGRKLNFLVTCYGRQNRWLLDIVMCLKPEKPSTNAIRTLSFFGIGKNPVVREFTLDINKEWTYSYSRNQINIKLFRERSGI